MADPAERTILITGASAGIGAACARMAAAPGVTVLLHYGANRAGAEAVAGEVRQAGGVAHLLQCDFSRPEGIAAMMEAVAPLADPDLPLHLVNNAGIVDRTASIADMTPERLTRMFTVNITAPILVAKGAVALMRRQNGGGAIVNISSAAARLGSGNQFLDYAASKGAIDSFTYGLADELAAEGIRVNAIRPGLIDTAIHAKGGEPDRADRLAHRVPMQRVGHPEEIAEAILWLLSEKASYVTRSILDVSGGR